VTLVIVFIGAICDYYFGAAGAALSALVIIASLSKSKANALFPLLLLIGLSWGAGALVAGWAGAFVGISLATVLALWLETGGRWFIAGPRRPQMSSRDSAGP
jgi:hypothetical protein